MCREAALQCLTAEVTPYRAVRPARGLTVLSGARLRLPALTVSPLVSIVNRN